MRNGLRFFINRTENTGGPSTFGLRLKTELLRRGWKWSRLLPDVNFLFGAGLQRPFCANIARMDGLYFDLSQTLGHNNKMNRPLYKAFQKSDGLIFQSEFDRQLFDAFVGPSPKKCTVIPNGAPDTFSPDGPKMEYGFSKVLCCSAHWRRHKRLGCIIRGFQEYANPDVGLVVLGKLENDLPDHPNIRYAGNVLPERLPYYLRGANAFVHLSWLDHCPNTVVEALACGLPVLCSHNGGTHEIVRDNGIVLRCEEDFEFAPVNLYDPPHCSPQTVAQGIHHILNWNQPVQADYLKIEHTAQRYMDFVYELLRNR